jgi:hypothetical protein
VPQVGSIATVAHVASVEHKAYEKSAQLGLDIFQPKQGAHIPPDVRKAIVYELCNRILGREGTAKHLKGYTPQT